MTYEGNDEVFRVEHPGGRFVASLLSVGGVDLDLFLLQDAICDGDEAFGLEEGRLLPPCLAISNNFGGGVSNREIIYFEELAPGTYYLAVDGRTSDDIGSYELALSCEFNCLTSEVPLACGQTLNDRMPSREEEPIGNYTSNYCSSNSTGSGSGTGATGNERSYVIDITTAGTYTFSLSVPPGSTADFQLALLNSVEVVNGPGETCGLFDDCVGIAANNGEGGAESLTLSLQPGEYFLVVDGWLSSFGDYTLTMTCDDENECGPTTYTVDPEFLPVLTQNGQYRFQGINDDILSEGSRFLINRQSWPGPINIPGSYTDGAFLFLDFGANAGAYEVCYAYQGEDECVNYRCTNLCVELPEDRTSVRVGHDRQEEDIILWLSPDEIDTSQVSQYTWYSLINGSIPGTISPNSSFSVFRLGYTGISNCYVQTRYARYFNMVTGCWRFTSQTYQICDPYECGNLSLQDTPSGEGVRLRLDSGAGPFIFTDDDTGEVLRTNSNFIDLAPEEECRTRNVCIQYYDLSLEATRLCCRTVEVCPPNNCPDPTFFEDTDAQVLTLSAGGNFRISAEGVAAGEPWLINREPRTGSTGDFIFLVGGVDQDVEVCFPIEDSNGCLSYVCEQYCLDGLNNSPEVLYNYNRETNTYRLTLNEDIEEISQPEWFSVSGEASPVSDGGVTAVVLAPTGCTTQTYYVRYRSGGCWRMARRTVYLCDPFACDGIGYRYVAENNTFSLSVESEVDETEPLAWVDDDTGDNLGTTPTIPVPVPPGDCQTRNISVRYYDATRRAWVICCRTIYLCDPNQCDGILYRYADETQAFNLSIEGADPTEPIAWVDDDTGGNLGSGATIPVPTPPGTCVTRNISVRYFDTFRQSWVICCRSIYLCSPENCEDRINFSYGNGNAVVTADIGDGSRNWFVDGNAAGSGGTLAVPLTQGQSAEVCVQYFDAGIGGFRTCCKNISIPDCELPSANFIIVEDDEQFVALSTAADPATATFGWEVDGVERSSAGTFPLDLPPGTYTVCLTVTNDCGSQRFCRQVSIPNTETDLVFRPRPGVCGAPGEVIDVPIFVDNFTDVLNYQLTIGLTDTSVAGIVGLELENIAGTEDFLLYDASRAAVIWENGTGLFFPDGTLLMTLKIAIRNGGPLNSDIILASGPVPRYAENGAGEEITVSLVRGTVGPCSEVTVSGALLTDRGRGIARATVSLYRNGTAVDQLITDATGRYEFTVSPDGANYVIRPSKLINYRNHVNSGDLSAVRRHIFGIAPLPGPYRRIAADASNIGNINSGDLSSIRQLIFGLIPAFPGVPSWEFVPENHVFPDADNPTASAYPREINLGRISGNLTDQNFIGLKMGDPSAGADPENARPDGPAVSGRSADNLKFMIGEAPPVRGIPWEMDVYTHNFTDMLASQFSLAWDPGILGLLEVKNKNVALNLTEENFSLANIREGQLPWLWFTGENAVSLPDSTLLFTLRFNIIGEVGDTATVRFSELPTEFFFENSGGEVAAMFSEREQIVEQLTSTSDAGIMDRMAVYPNPTASAFYLSAIPPGAYTVELFSLQGQLLRSWKQDGLGTAFETDDLAGGTYMVVVRQAERSAVRRLVVRR